MDTSVKSFLNIIYFITQNLNFSRKHELFQRYFHLYQEREVSILVLTLCIQVTPIDVYLANSEDPDEMLHIAAFR